MSNGGIAMLTNFGKALRRLRLENNELLKDMADKLNVSSAYLSAVENGKKKATTSLLNRVVELYKLSDEDAIKLELDFQRSLDEIRVNTSELSPEQEDLAMVFARKISSIDDASMKKIMEILKN